MGGDVAAAVGGWRDLAPAAITSHRSLRECSTSPLIARVAIVDGDRCPSLDSRDGGLPCRIASTTYFDSVTG